MTTGDNAVYNKNDCDSPSYLNMSNAFEHLQNNADCDNSSCHNMFNFSDQTVINNIHVSCHEPEVAVVSSSESVNHISSKNVSPNMTTASNTAHNQNDCSSTDYTQLQEGKVPNFKTKGIKFGHLNIRSLVSKIDDFRYMCGTNFDIISVNETYCDNTVSDNEVRLDGFNVLRKDRNRGGGGVAVFINYIYDFKRRDDLCNDDIECIWVEIVPPHTNAILVCALYFPDGMNNDLNDKLCAMLSKANNEDKELVLLGDFNCDYLKIDTCKQVGDLKFICDMHQLTQLIDLPTRVTAQSKTLIDLFYTSKYELFNESGVIQTSLSDHYMIYAIRRAKPMKGQHKTINYRSFKDFDEDNFISDLSDLPWDDIERIDNVDEALNVWYSMLFDVVDKHLPKKSKRAKSSPSPWLSSEIKQCMHNRDHLHRVATRTNDIVDWQAYKCARNKVTSMIRSAKCKYYKTVIQESGNDSGKLWQTLRSVIPSKDASTPASIVYDDVVHTSNNDIANAFNEHFTSVASKLVDQNSDNTGICNISSSCKNDKAVFNMPHITYDFVDKEICAMSMKKATGLDDISCKILKLARPVIVKSLVYIMNLSISTGVFPASWKEAKVNPLHKSGDMDNTNNYRPISILPVLSKILERAIHKHVYSFLSDQGLLSDHQSGFRPGHSTETALVDMVDEWLTSINKGEMTGVAFIDLRKAFDTVSHDILLKKII